MRALLTAVATLVILAPSAGAQAPVLAGTTTITAPAGGGVTAVRIPAPIGLPYIIGKEQTFAFAPAEAPAVLILRERSAVPEPFTAAATHIPAPGLVPCAGLHCETPVHMVHVSKKMEYGGPRGVPRRLVPPGEYDLYLVGGGGPFTLRLTLPELGGGAAEIALPAGGPADLRLHAEADGLHPIAGLVGTLDATGMRASYLRHDQTITAATRIESCLYEGEPQHPLAFGPRCPGAASSFEFNSLIPSTQVSLASTNLNAPAGTTGVGGNVEAAGPGVLSHVGVWIPYRPAPAGSGSPPSASQPPAPAPAAEQIEGAPAEILARRARARRGRITVRLRCSGPGRCTGILRSRRTRTVRFTWLPAPPGRSGCACAGAAGRCAWRRSPPAP